MVNLKKILNEDVGSIWSPRQYSASSMAPRKDQGPLFSQKDGKNFPYQQNSPPIFPPSTTEPQKPETFPWPMQTINTDLADGFVYLLAAAKKISQCAKQNPSLTAKQKDELLLTFKKMLKILKAVETIGLSIPEIVNMASETDLQDPQRPAQSPLIQPTTQFSQQQSARVEAQKL